MKRAPLSQVSFGDPTAEADGLFLFDRGCFIETDLFKRCLSLEAPLFVVGRRGAGKTALCMALKRHFRDDSSVICTVVIPSSFYFAHAKSLAKLITRDSETNWEFLFTSLWATTLRVEWARGLLRYYKVRDSEHDDLTTLEEYVGATAPDPTESASARISRYLREIVEVLESPERDVVGRINTLLAALRAEQITRSIRRVAEASSVQLVTLVDGLDENWDGSNTSAELLSGLLTQAAADYAAIGVKAYAFIRENIYRRVRNLCPRWDRIEGYFETLSWTEEELEELIVRRIRRSVETEDVRWDDVFEPRVRGQDSRTYLLRKTQFKPREVILFCRYALDAARKHRAPQIRECDVLEAETRYSENRLTDLINEYRDSLPELNSVLELFVGLPQRFELDELLSLLRDHVAAGRYAERAPRLSLMYPNVEAVIELLLGVGFVGVRVRGSSEYVFKYYGQQGNVFKELGEIEEFVIHPAFEMALGLKPEKGPLSVKEAGEADIVAAASAVAAWSAAAYEEAGNILSTLREIPFGVGGFRRYEELMRRAIAYGFRGYLDNGQIQERSWSGTQIRDLVFDNTGETRFCRSIREKHGAVTVPFECKNKAELEAADFHQIETRLSDTTGYFGFICYRSSRREPVKAEILHLREIHGRDKRKVALLLSDANLTQILDRRLRGKLDEFLFRWYTTYLRLYLS